MAHRVVTTVVLTGLALLTTACGGGNPSAGPTTSHSTSTTTTHTPTPATYDPGPGYQAAPDQSNLLEAADLQREALRALVCTHCTTTYTWTTYPVPAEPTLVCQNANLSTLHPRMLFSRKFQTQEGHAFDKPVVHEALLEYPSQAAAAQAAATITKWLKDCPATLAPADARQWGPIRVGAVGDPQRAFDSGAFRGMKVDGYVFLCRTGCDVGVWWRQYVGVSGNRVLAVQLSGPLAQDSGPVDSAFEAVLRQADARAAL